MRSDARFAVHYVAAVLCAGLLGLAALTACQDKTTPDGHPSQFGTILTVPAGQSTYLGASTSSKPCGKFLATVSLLATQTRPGGWFAVDGDTYARATDPDPQCLRQGTVWVQGQRR